MGNLLHRSVFTLQALSVHPALWLDLEQPILGCGNAAKIFPDMLFSYIPDWNFVSVAIHNGNSKQLLGQENALRVMAKCPVAKVCEECFRLIKPVVNREVVFRFSAELPDAAFGVLEWVGHGLTPHT
jgi:hypothetical protein